MKAGKENSDNLYSMFTYIFQGQKDWVRNEKVGHPIRHGEDLDDIDIYNIFILNILNIFEVMLKNKPFMTFHQ